MPAHSGVPFHPPQAMLWHTVAGICGSRPVHATGVARAVARTTGPRRRMSTTLSRHGARIRLARRSNRRAAVRAGSADVAAGDAVAERVEASEEVVAARRVEWH